MVAEVALEKPRGQSFARQAGMRCSSEAFQRFLFEEGYAVALSREAATDAVREFCGVESRREIVAGTEAADHWRLLEDQFQLWMSGYEP
jgi:hypothetical protein